MKKCKSPLLSIVIPTFNCDPFIPRLLKNLEMQSEKDVEFIFIDGGSTDNTYQIISSFDDERVSFRLSEKDDGVASALNKGFSQARGKYLTWMNADDEYFDNFSLSHVNNLIRAGSADFVLSNYKLVNYESGKSRVNYAYPVSIDRYSKENNCNIFTGAMFFSSESWVKFGSFDEDVKLAFEYELICFLVKSFVPKMLNKVISVYYLHENALSAKFAAQLSRERDLILVENGFEQKMSITDVLKRVSFEVLRGNALSITQNMIFADKFDARSDDVRG